MGTLEDMSDQQTSHQKTAEEWRLTLSPEQFRVLRQHGTERAGTSPLNDEKRQGTVVCAGCGVRIHFAHLGRGGDEYEFVVGGSEFAATAEMEINLTPPAPFPKREGGADNSPFPLREGG